MGWYDRVTRIGRVENAELGNHGCVMTKPCRASVILTRAPNRAKRPIYD
jgi:hypothetical protein